MKQDSRKKETILFVDDEESILDIAKTYFEGQGYRVLTARNGREALDVLGHTKVDCCFTDINMPVMSGIELAGELHRLDNTLPVVVMTGFPSLETTIETLKNGVVDFLVKPVNLNQMELSLRRVLRERRLLIQNVLLSKEVEGKARLEKLNTELMAKIDELNILNRIMADFTKVRESSGIFSRLVKLACEVTHADRACFHVFNDEIRHPVAIASFPENIPPGLQQELETSRMEALINEAMRNAAPTLHENGGRDSRLPEHTFSCLLVPMKIREKTFGVLDAAIFSKRRGFGSKDVNYLAFMVNKAAYAVENLALYENIYDNLLATLYAFVKAIEARDPYTEQHSNRVTQIALALADSLGCSQEEKDILNVAGRLHDIGKIGIRDSILLKPGRLTPEEYNIIKQHPVIGAEIVDQLGLWNREKQIIRAHHERYDGKGYPDGLRKNEIPMLARILSVADVFDAIASDRAYRRRMEEGKILEIMYGGAGTQFDPRVVDVFRHLYDQGVLKRIVRYQADQPCSAP